MIHTEPLRDMILRLAMTFANCAYVENKLVQLCGDPLTLFISQIEKAKLNHKQKYIKNILETLTFSWPDHTAFIQVIIA